MTEKMHIKLTVNGEEREFLAEPRELLIYALRENLNITGPHVGCETSHCGACTVTLNGKSVKSCTMFVAQANGAEITTIEGIGTPDSLHVLQEATSALLLAASVLLLEAALVLFLGGTQLWGFACA